MGQPGNYGSRETASLFRKASVTRQRQRFLGDVLLAGPASTPYVVVAAGFILATLLALTLLVQVPAKLHAPGVLLPVGGLTRVMAQEAGVIGEVLAASGDTVVEGQPLMTLLVDRRLTDGAGSYATRADSVARQRGLLDRIRGEERKTHDSRLEALRVRRNALRDRLQALNERLLNVKRQAELAESEYQRLDSLAPARFATTREVEAAELRLLQARSVEQQLKAELNHARLEAVQVEHELETERHAFLARDLSLASDSERLNDRQVELRSLARRTIVAPRSGRLADVLVSSGKTISAGATVANMHRSGSAMEARLYLSSLVAGRAQPGQETLLKVPTFPSRQFGVLRGRILELTSAPMDPRSVSLVPSLAAPVYEARIQLHSQHMSAMGKQWQLRPGLSVEGTIIESRRTLISWLLEPLIRGVGAPKNATSGGERANLEASL